MRKRLPVGEEGFEDIISQDFYYVDKTGFITEFLHNWSKVNLFTRPRRFGKSLNMSMLKAFFEIGTDPGLFENLKISQNKQLCERFMGKYPVISITLKGVSGLTLEHARNALRFVIGNEAGRFSFLRETDRLTEEEKQSYRALISVDIYGDYSMSATALDHSLLTLSRLLRKYYNQKVILLIDEYDVPLDQAYQNGYYDSMVGILRNIFSNGLKTNENLQFAVLTGCLRISKESIFTGLNNLRVNTISDTKYEEFFGFSEKEVQELLAYYGLGTISDTIKEWYDGYKFGEKSIYCPWDVMNYCESLLSNQNAYPMNYWANSSGNALIRRFIDMADATTKQEIEQLIAGETIWKEINLELTYNELDRTIENLWSVLFTTGYLTICSTEGMNKFELKIPNREIHSLFVSQIQEWFRDTAGKDTGKLEQLCNAVQNGDTELIEVVLNEYLWDGISIRDSAVRNKYKENFYHGMLFGLLQYRSKWIMKSNEESGIGYSDLLIKTPERIGIVFEVKYTDSVDELENGCIEALKQIELKKYDARLKAEGMKKILKYGVAFYLKNCKIIKA